MRLAGFCPDCGTHVYLAEQWGCVNGHAWDRISGWYDADTGAPVMPYWQQAEPASTPADQPAAPAAAAAQPPAEAPADARSALLSAIVALFARYPGYRVQSGTDTDLVIDNQIADASWGIGKKKIEYSAILKAVEAERTVYFWEILKESGAGLSFGGFESESYSTFGTKRSGKTKQVVIGPGGVQVDAEWDYGATRKLVESVAAAQGWRVKVVLRRGAAAW